MAVVPFERCVFINCPFDGAYAPILQAILFCILYLDYEPRVATERMDSGEARLEKIAELIAASKYSIHDLSRAQAEVAGELFRLNMPFELGIDVGCRQFGSDEQRSKSILILEKEKYRYKATLSDIGGFDIQSHNDDFDVAIRKVRNWLVSEAHLAHAAGATRILNALVAFQGWNYERLLTDGFSEQDITDYPTIELLDAMKEWIAKGKPV